VVFLNRLFHTHKDRQLIRLVKQLTGIRPGKLEIYREALRHSSVNAGQSVKRGRHSNDNERLEFLGDAILDAVVADLLFKRYPFREEGFMTEMRTRIVSRNQLTNLAQKMGLVQYMEIHPDLLRNPHAMKVVGCNALEALIGAVYLDKGYTITHRFIARKLIDQHLDLEKIMETEISYKARLIKWAQKMQKKLVFESEAVTQGRNQKLHKVRLMLEDQELLSEINHSKKLAEELASEKACGVLGV
jgi:ribonuclease-3